MGNSIIKDAGSRGFVTGRSVAGVLVLWVICLLGIVFAPGCARDVNGAYGTNGSHRMYEPAPTLPSPTPWTVIAPVPGTETGHAKPAKRVIARINADGNTCPGGVCTPIPTPVRPSIDSAQKKTPSLIDWFNVMEPSAAPATAAPTAKPQPSWETGFL